MPDPNQTQEETEAQRKMAEELSDKTDPFAGIQFEATGTNEPPPNPQPEEPAPTDPRPGEKVVPEPGVDPGLEPEKTTNPAEQSTAMDASKEAEKRFLERLNREAEDQKELLRQKEEAVTKQKLAQEHGLGADPTAPTPPTPQEMAIIQRVREGDAQMQQAMIDDLFKVINHYKPPNLTTIAIMELIKDEYIRLSKGGPNKAPQGNIAVPGGAPKPGGIVTPGMGPVPPRGGRA